MLARLRKMQEENEGGFTLIELLVVIIIIGILAAIAIPVFLQQRKKGYDAAIKSDLVAAATAEETYLTDFNTYTDSTANLATTETFKFSAAGDYTGGTAGSDHRVQHEPGLLHHRRCCFGQHVVLRQWRRWRSAAGGWHVHLLGHRRQLI